MSSGGIPVRVLNSGTLNQILTTDREGNTVWTDQKEPVFRVRGVVYSNVADLTAFTVAATDLTFVAGDMLLLANQTTAAQCGLYVVGTVGGGTALLVRIDSLPAGAPYVNGTEIAISEGTLFAGSKWVAMCTGSKVVGTDDPLFYPRICKATVTLSSGTYSLGATEGLFLWSLTTSMVSATRQTAGGTLTSTTHYYAPSASSGRVAGKSGTGVVTVKASVAAGTVNAADTSTIDVVVFNF